ncbi:hypothetical protein EX30DRAFT_344010 [Ascodesmis nigricans]|uniref:Uncharacterized protein n=1 Tax=Ascodesmis nigricans TaxID=341454 RepID=A0A4S2MKV2_9PEZI|nr:hypothetical protein EX30DRAFT_344010 [Ascodesmis nigricans]
MPPPTPLLTHPVITLSPPAPDASRILSVRFTLTPPAQTDPATTPVLNGDGLPDGDVVVEFQGEEGEGLEHNDDDGEEGGTQEGDSGADGVKEGKQAEDIESTKEWEPLSARSDASGHYFHLSRAGPASSSISDNTTTNSKENENENANNKDNDGDEPSPTTTTGPPTALPLPLPLPPSLGPLSTAHLLYHENRPYTAEFLLPDPTLPSFFASRPIVQAPSILIPGRDNIVLFRIAGGVTVPSVVRVGFTPRWGGGEVVLAEVVAPITSSQSAASGPDTASATSAETKAETQQQQEEDVNAPWPLPASAAESLHTLWAQLRLTDLQALMDVARELEEEGRRGKTTGRVKIGVEGGGMDEEAVRREGWLVGEEVAWVGEVYGVGVGVGVEGQGATTTKESPVTGANLVGPEMGVVVNASMGQVEEVVKGLEEEGKTAPSPATPTDTSNFGFGLGLGLGLATQDNAVETARIIHMIPETRDMDSKDEKEDKEEKEKEELFALPLSPRSPDMVQGPFAVWR